MATYIEKVSAGISLQKYFQENISASGKIYYQSLPEDLLCHALENGEGVLNDTGALVIDTGEFTGRSPKDRFIVKDAITGQFVNWNDFNQPIDEEYFTGLFNKMMEYIKNKELWIRDCCVCAKDN